MNAAADDSSNEAKLCTAMEEIDGLLERSEVPEQELEGVLAKYPDPIPDQMRDYYRACKGVEQLVGTPLWTPKRQPTSSQPASPPRPVTRWLGDYGLMREVGRGAMGVVHEAWQRSLRRIVAIKMIRDGALASRHEVDRLRREAEAAARIQHSGVVKVYAFGEEEDQPYICMEYIEGRSLAAVVRDQPLPAAQAARVVRALAEAVHAAHEKGILHRDLKPSNILIEPGGQPRVTDFGLAGLLEGDSGLTQTGAVVGTASYMAPEQAKGETRDLKPAADVYGLGAILYEALTGRPPFRAATPAETQQQVLNEEPVPPRRLQPDVPGDLETICLKCLHKEPSRRYTRAADLADDLGRFLEGRPILARPAGPLERTGRWCRRNPAVAGLLTVAALMLVAITVVSLVAAHLSNARAEADQERAQEAENRAELEQQTARLLRQAGLLQEAQLILTASRDHGWSERARQRLEEAVRLGRPEPVRDQAPRTLSGLDATPGPELGQFGAMDLIFDARGDRLLMSGLPARYEWSAAPARIWHRTTKQLQVVSPPGKGGPVGFKQDGTPVRLIQHYEDEWNQYAFVTRLLAPVPLSFVSAITLRHLEPDPDWLELWDLDGQRVTRLLPPWATEERPSRGWVFPRMGEYPTPVAVLSSDAALVAASWYRPSEESLITVWEAATGKLVAEFPQKVARSLAFSPDGTVLAAGDDYGLVTVWSLAEGKAVAKLRSGYARISALAFSPNGRMLATGDWATMVTLWDWDLKQRLQRCRGSEHHIYALAFNPDGTLLASSGRAVVKLWDTATGANVLTLRGEDYAVGLAFSPDGRQLAVSRLGIFGPPGVRLWDLENGRGMRTFRGLEGYVSTLQLSPDGSLLAALTNHWEVGVWDFATGHLKRVLRAPAGLFATHAALAFSPDNGSLAFSTQRDALIWDLTTGKQKKSVRLPPGLDECLAFDATGQRLFSVRWESLDGRRVPTQSDEQSPHVCQLRDLLSPGGVANPLKTITEFNTRIHWVRLMRGGSLFLVEGQHGNDKGESRAVAAYDLATGERRWIIPSRLAIRPEAAAASVALDPAGEIIAVRLEDKPDTSQLIDLKTGTVTGNLDAIPSGLGRKAEYLVSVPFDKTLGDNRGVVLTRPSQKEPLIRLGMEARAGQADVLFTQDGRYLLWGNADGTITVADLPAVRERLTRLGVGW